MTPRESGTPPEHVAKYLPELFPLCHFCEEIYRLFDDDQVVRMARRRRT